MSDFWLEAREASEAASRLWWVFVLFGLEWLLVSFIIFRFDWVSVLAIAILFGVIAVTAGVLEFAVAMASTGAWRYLRFVLGMIFIAIGIVAFFRPGHTFVALAAVISFFFVFAGAFDIVNSIATRSEFSGWWLQLISGIVQVGLGFWAAGYWNRSVILLVVWAGATTMFRGVAMLVFGFKLHQLRKNLGPSSETLKPPGVAAAV